jgi:hypothetical protein
MSLKEAEEFSEKQEYSLLKIGMVNFTGIRF